MQHFRHGKECAILHTLRDIDHCCPVEGIIRNLEHDAAKELRWDCRDDHLSAVDGGRDVAGDRNSVGNMHPRKERRILARRAYLRGVLLAEGPE